MRHENETLRNVAIVACVATVGLSRSRIAAGTGGARVLAGMAKEQPTWSQSHLYKHGEARRNLHVIHQRLVVNLSTPLSCT